MRECRIDRIRLCRTGSDERNLSALLMTNAGSSLNSTLSSMREILSDRSIGRNASTARRASWERVTGYSQVTELLHVCRLDKQHSDRQNVIVAVSASPRKSGWN